MSNRLQLQILFITHDSALSRLFRPTEKSLQNRFFVTTRPSWAGVKRLDLFISTRSTIVPKSWLYEKIEDKQ